MRALGNGNRIKTLEPIIRMTTSAASDEALAPRAPIAMPTLAAAKAGASLIPSPTIKVGFKRCSVATASTLSDGTRSASTASRSSAALNGFSGIRPIAGQHDYSRYAC